MTKLHFEKNIFDAIHHVMGQYRRNVDNVTKRYIDGCKQIDAERYNAERTAELKAAKLQSCRKELSEFRDNSSRIVSIQLDKVRDAVKSYAAEVPNDSFIRLLDTLNKSGVTVDREEFASIASLADGSYWSQKCLAKLADDSGFSYSFPSLAVLNGVVGKIQHGCNEVFGNYYGADQSGWELDENRDPLRAVFRTTAANYIDNGGFRNDTDFLLNKVDPVCSISPAPILKAEPQNSSEER